MDLSRTRVMFSAMRATFIPPRKTFLIHMHITNSIRQVIKHIGVTFQNYFYLRFLRNNQILFLCNLIVDIKFTFDCKLITLYFREIEIKVNTSHVIYFDVFNTYVATIRNQTISRLFFYILRKPCRNPQKLFD